jgi:hypothetical protein
MSRIADDARCVPSRFVGYMMLQKSRAFADVLA